MTVTGQDGRADGLGDRMLRGDWVRLRTLILLRWTAIFGQAMALLVASAAFDVDLRLAECLLVVGAAVVANLLSVYAFPQSRRLSDLEALGTFVFDSLQLAALLALTGGLSNPFALLMLAPVTIAATTLRTAHTVIVGLVGIGLVTLVSLYHLPLRLKGGEFLAVPGMIEFGFWAALVIGIVFIGLYAGKVSSEIHMMHDALLATQMALAREQKLTDLGGVVAATAHELGTPLATIKLVSSELMELLPEDSDLRSDVDLIRAQAGRCGEILQSMGRAGKDDLHMRSAPVEAVVREAAEPHRGRGRQISVSLLAGMDAPQPAILRRPEVIHGVRNLVQNAVDFARTAVWIDIGWTDREITIRIEDDGPGFPPEMLGRIGDPFLRGRRKESQERERPGYEGMGLGLFIAKTLLQRTGADISFANGRDPFLTEGENSPRSGASVSVTWPRDLIEAPAGPLGENRQIEA
jgi:two-component system sensor histidine kinase RegB